MAHSVAYENTVKIFRDRLQMLIYLDYGTQNAFCEKHEVDQAQFNGWFNGRTLPSAMSLIKICDALGVSMDYMLGRTDDCKVSKE